MILNGFKMGTLFVLQEGQMIFMIFKWGLAGHSMLPAVMSSGFFIVMNMYYHKKYRFNHWDLK